MVLESTRDQGRVKERAKMSQTPSLLLQVYYMGPDMRVLKKVVLELASVKGGLLLIIPEYNFI